MIRLDGLLLGTLVHEDFTDGDHFVSVQLSTPQRLPDFSNPDTCVTVLIGDTPLPEWGPDDERAAMPPLPPAGSYERTDVTRARQPEDWEIPRPEPLDPDDLDDARPYDAGTVFSLVVISRQLDYIARQLERLGSHT